MKPGHYSRHLRDGAAKLSGYLAAITGAVFISLVIGVSAAAAQTSVACPFPVIVTECFCESGVLVEREIATGNKVFMDPASSICTGGGSSGNRGLNQQHEDLKQSILERIGALLFEASPEGGDLFDESAGGGADRSEEIARIKARLGDLNVFIQEGEAKLKEIDARAAEINERFEPGIESLEAQISEWQLELAQRDRFASLFDEFVQLAKDLHLLRNDPEAAADKFSMPVPEATRLKEERIREVEQRMDDYRSVRDTELVDIGTEEIKNTVRGLEADLAALKAKRKAEIDALGGGELFVQVRRARRETARLQARLAALENQNATPLPDASAGLAARGVEAWVRADGHVFEDEQVGRDLSGAGAGLVAGAHVRPREDLVVGLGGGYAVRDSDDESGAGVSADSDTVSVSPYAAFRASETVSLDASVSYALTMVETSRAGGVTGDYDVDTFGFNLGVNVSHPISPATKLAGRVAHSYAHSDAERFVESDSTRQPGSTDEFGLLAARLHVRQVMPDFLIYGGFTAHYDTVKRADGIDRFGGLLTGGLDVPLSQGSLVMEMDTVLFRKNFRQTSGSVQFNLPF